MNHSCRVGVSFLDDPATAKVVANRFAQASSLCSFMSLLPLEPRRVPEGLANSREGWIWQFVFNHVSKAEVSTFRSSSFDP